MYFLPARHSFGENYWLAILNLMRLLIIAFLLLFPALSNPVYGQQIFKCTDESGTIIFSDKPCAKEAEQIHVEDSQSGLSLSDAEQDSELDPSSDTNNKSSQSENEATQNRPTAGPPGLSQHDEQRLRTLERQLDSVRGKIQRQSPYTSEEAKAKLIREASSLQREIQLIRQNRY